MNATERANVRSTCAKVKDRINILLLSLRCAYNACSITLDENDGDRLNITGMCFLIWLVCAFYFALYAMSGACAVMFDVTNRCPITFPSTR